MGSRRFAVLDRDGTIIRERVYLADPEQVELLPGAAVGMRTLAELGLGLIVVTNQSGLARGYFDTACLESIHHRMSEMLAAEGVSLDGIYVCPHLPDDGCACRKPSTGLLLRAAAEHRFAPAECFIMGDKACDVELGRAADATTFLVRTGYGVELAAAGYALADYTVDDLSQAARVVESLLGAAAERG